MDASSIYLEVLSVPPKSQLVMISNTRINLPPGHQTLSDPTEVTMLSTVLDMALSLGYLTLYLGFRFDNFKDPLKNYVQFRKRENPARD